MVDLKGQTTTYEYNGLGGLRKINFTILPPEINYSTASKVHALVDALLELNGVP